MIDLKSLIAGALGGLIVFFGSTFGGGMLGGSYDSTTFENPINFSDAVDFNGTIELDGATEIDGATHVDGTIVFNNVNSTTTTATTYTLVAADIVDYDTVFITPNTGDLTLTLPASSTLSAYLPNAGDRTVQCWYNASTTAGIDVTFAAGTGIDFEVASSTIVGAALQKTLLANGGGCFHIIRKPATATAFDLLYLYHRYAN